MIPYGFPVSSHAEVVVEIPAMPRGSLLLNARA